MDSFKEKKYNPAPKMGCGRCQFDKISENGFGDGNNSYAHSAAWFNGALYVGTTRCNMCMLKFSVTHNAQNPLSEIDIWPVDCPDTIEGIYELDRRAQIWRYRPENKEWKMVYRSPLIPPEKKHMKTLKGKDGKERKISTSRDLVPRDIGYRGMCVFKGKSDKNKALYIASWAPSLAPGPLIIRTEDGENFEIVSDYGVIDLPVTSIRSLVEFKGRLYMSPTGSRGGNANTSGVQTIYSSDDPRKGKWIQNNISGFGDEKNESIFSLAVSDDWLYAGTFNCNGYQIWRTTGDDLPIHKWECVVKDGAGRGPENQIALSMCFFKGKMYVGSGIQNGGYDRVNKIGPAASTLIVIDEKNGSTDLVVGTPYKREGHVMTPTSGLTDGFGNSFNGYFWRMTHHEGWLYLGTYDASSLIEWINTKQLSKRMSDMFNKIDLEYINNNRGFELWRSHDGENWIPVDRKGFGSVYNNGIRNLVSTPEGLFVGTANPFGPTVAKKENGEWIYRENPKGGLEVWIGK